MKFGIAVSALLLAWTAGAQEWSVTSPDGEVKLTLHLAPATNGAPKPGRLTYTIEQGANSSRAIILREAPLGLRLKGMDLATGLELDKAQSAQAIEQSYTLPYGKRLACHAQANQIAVTFRNAAGQKLDVEARAANDGVAFRYRIPSGPAGRQVFEAEATGFALPAGARQWCAPSDKPGTYSPAYETYYVDEQEAGAASPTGFGWSFPLLFRTSDSSHWALITEAGLDETFCGSRLSNTASNGIYTVNLPDPAEGNGQGDIHPVSTLPWTLPWRVIITGSSLRTIVESTMVTDLCPPSRIQNPNWVRPGRVAWSWWSDNSSPKDASKQKQFIDLAAEMGWEYVLVDANWTIMENGNIHDVLRYARQKNIGVLLWYNSGGINNVVPEKPRDCLSLEPVRKYELELLHKWGVQGIKVDFFQSDKQDVIGLYLNILRDAARQKIMVDFHGCTLPRGWQRTYPNLLSMEAVRGAECYIFDSQYPDKAPVQNTILPFTRNVAGPMDFTPVTFTDNHYPHKTTQAHELALAVIFESGWLHFADKVEAYRSLPAEPKNFLRQVATAWDETRFVAGYPGKFVVLARRKGTTWFLCGINGQGQDQSLAVPGDWLPPGKFQMTLIQDGADGRSFSSRTQEVHAERPLELRMLPRGGFAATIKPQ
jgi:alpha-glucosidase